MTAATEPVRRNAFAVSARALRRAAGYALPAELDRRLLALGERNDDLTADERAELLAWVAFTQERSAERLEAELALRRLTAALPDSTAGP